MSGLSLFLKGCLLGLSIAAPVGPIGILCIRISISEGRFKGFVSGLGAATADAFYGLIAGFGLTSATQFLINQSLWVRLFGGVFLGYLGIRTITKYGNLEFSGHDKTGLLRTYLSTFFLTLTNPLTILSFAAIFAGLGFVSRGTDIRSACLLVFGVFLGSASWWFILSWSASLFGAKLKRKTFKWINRIAGVVLLCFALIAVISAFNGA